MLRLATSKLAGCAIKSLFPKATLLGGGAFDYGFYYDFILENQTIDEEALLLLEDRMRALISENLPFRCTEMVRHNAADYFKYQKQFSLAKQILQSKDALVQVVHIGDHCDLCSDALEGSTKDCAFFKLLDVAVVKEDYPGAEGQAVIRLRGTVHSSKDKLKEFFKKWRQGTKNTHQVLGEELGLFSFPNAERPQECFWHPSGVHLRDLVCNWREQQLEKLGVASVRTPSPKAVSQSAYLHYFKNKVDKIAELYPEEQRLHSYECVGLWRTSSYMADEGRCLSSPQAVKQDLISYLQFINETYTMLGSGFSWQLQGGRGSSKKQDADAMKKFNWVAGALESAGISYERAESRHKTRACLCYTDAYGKQWSGPFVGFDAMSTDDSVMIVSSLTGSIERFIAWLLERPEGIQPFMVRE